MKKRIGTALLCAALLCAAARGEDLTDWSDPPAGSAEQLITQELKESGYLPEDAPASDWGKGDEQTPVDETPSQYVSTPTPYPAFTVTKNALTHSAYPGDTVTYEIRIQNTGTMTLHSVISTEKFVGAGVKAYFREQEGLRLNESRTQALIEQLEPGGEAVLSAYVVIPGDAQAQQLINQVEVSTQETGSQSLSSESIIPLITPTPDPINGGGDSGNQAQTHPVTSQVGEVPKTGDDTPTLRWLALMLLGLGAACGVALGVWRRQRG